MESNRGDATMSKPASHTARTFHEDALSLLTEAWHQAKDKAELWAGEEVRLRLEIQHEIARGQAAKGESR